MGKLKQSIFAYIYEWHTLYCMRIQKRAVLLDLKKISLGWLYFPESNTLAYQT
jgi:hypothetical protein